MVYFTIRADSLGESSGSADRLVVPHHRAESTSSNSVDENDPQVTSARDQLSSIPDPSEAPLIRLEQQRGEAPKPPIQLSQLIAFVTPQSIFDYLPIKDVLPFVKVN